MVDGTTNTLTIHEFGHNVDSALREQFSTLNLKPSDFEFGQKTFEYYQAESKRRFANMRQYNGELISLTEKYRETTYTGANEAEAFAEEFAEYTTNLRSKYGKAFGKFLKKWRKGV